jgi:hypothetical protein
VLVVRFTGYGEHIDVVGLDGKTRLQCVLLHDSEGLITGEADRRDILWRELPLKNWTGFVEYGCGTISNDNDEAAVDWKDLTVIGYVADIATWRASHIPPPKLTWDRGVEYTASARPDVRLRK